MGAHLFAFIGVAVLLIVIPGPDTAVLTKNVLVHGRRAGLGTAFGVGAGLSMWTVASAVGLASLVRASAVAYTALKLVGAVYLIWLGVQALRAAGQERSSESVAPEWRRSPLGAVAGFRQGLLSDLANPKIGVFFTSLLPQFVSPGHAHLLPFLILGSIFVVMTIAWLCAYALAAAGVAQTLLRPRVQAAMDRITGVVLIAIGLRLATERR
jgi:RhtB (resistance to homoserine/threonine) family protein